MGYDDVIHGNFGGYGSGDGYESGGYVIDDCVIGGYESGGYEIGGYVIDDCVIGSESGEIVDVEHMNDVSMGNDDV